MKDMIIQNARQGNLKDVTLQLPKEKFIVFTGVSGSGKSTLAIDVLFHEAQRQYLEAMNLQGIQKPDVDYIKHISPAILITQHSQNKNPRSSLGTQTNIYTDLRMIYEKLHSRICPNCHSSISASSCKEETEKKDNEFKVYMYCSKCNHKMDKLTRSHFSYNTKVGACPTCLGLGSTLTIKETCVLDDSLSLENGAIAFWDHAYKEYMIATVYIAFQHYHVAIKPNTIVKEFNKLQKALLLHGVESEEVKNLCPNIQPPKTAAGGKLEGVYTTLWRRLSEKGSATSSIKKYFEETMCTMCSGERLNIESREANIMNTRLPQLVTKSLVELQTWLCTLEANLNETQIIHVEHYILDLKTKIDRIIKVGLKYLSLDRSTKTLSGGESQRLKLAAMLDSDLTGIMYIMDEPTMSLHPKDTQGVITILKKLRDLGNTVIVIEHDSDVIKEADYIVDIGPKAGIYGGEIVAIGSLNQILQQPSSITGAYLNQPFKIKDQVRQGDGHCIKIKNANLHNLKNITVNFPTNCLISITGVSGSGKSSLIFGLMARGLNCEGLAQFHQIITIEQAQISRMKRSNIATYSGVYTEIRSIFANQSRAKKQGLTHRDFSFNSKGGRCDHCEGLGVVTSNMLFFQDVEVPCPLCKGKQFHDHILNITYEGFNIHQVLNMTIEEVILLFHAYPKVKKILTLLQDVGLGYLTLGQSLTTLSGGEGQRLKLAKELLSQAHKHNLYLIDEPTVGLHPHDVDKFLILMDRIVDAGNTVIVIEHNPQIIMNSDWVIDLGPDGGVDGGHVIAEGTPNDIIKNESSVTGTYIIR